MKCAALLQVQDAMLQGMWSREVLALPNCGAAGGTHNDIQWYGPRVRMGMYEGEPTRIVPHTTSGRADYFGPLVNRCSIPSAAFQPDMQGPRHMHDTFRLIWTKIQVHQCSFAAYCIKMIAFAYSCSMFLASRMYTIMRTPVDVACKD